MVNVILVVRGSGLAIDQWRALAGAVCSFGSHLTSDVSKKRQRSWMSSGYSTVMVSRGIQSLKQAIND